MKKRDKRVVSGSEKHDFYVTSFISAPLQFVELSHAFAFHFRDHNMSNDFRGLIA